MAVAAAAPGEKTTRGRPLARGLLLLLVAAIVGGGAWLVVRIVRARRVPYQVSCTGHSIVIENRTAGPRDVAIGSIQLDVGYPWSSEVRNLRGGSVNGSTGEPVEVERVAPDERAVFGSRIENADAYRCGFTSFGDGNPAPHARRCRFRFTFAVRKGGAAGDGWVDAHGSCRPELDTETVGTVDDAPPQLEDATGADRRPSEG